MLDNRKPAWVRYYLQVAQKTLGSRAVFFIGCWVLGSLIGTYLKHTAGG